MLMAGPYPAADGQRSPGWNVQEAAGRLNLKPMNARSARLSHLVLIDRSGAKRKIRQPSAVQAIIEAEQAIRRQRHHLREVKVVSQHRAIARWKAAGLGWRRVV